MDRVHEAVDVDDSNRLDTAFVTLAGRATHVLFGQRGKNIAERADPFAHRQDIAPWHDQLGGIPVQLERRNALGAATAEDVTETLGGDQRRLDPFTFEDGVGRHGGAMPERGDLGAVDAGLPQSVDHAIEKCRRRGGDLADTLLAGLQVDLDDVGESATDVGADDPATIGHLVSPCLALASCGQFAAIPPPARRVARGPGQAALLLSAERLVRRVTGRT